MTNLQQLCLILLLATCAIQLSIQSTESYETSTEEGSNKTYEATFTFQNDDFLEVLNWTVQPREQSTGYNGLVVAMVRYNGVLLLSFYVKFYVKL